MRAPAVLSVCACKQKLVHITEETTHEHSFKCRETDFRLLLGSQHDFRVNNYLDTKQFENNMIVKYNKGVTRYTDIIRRNWKILEMHDEINEHFWHFSVFSSLDIMRLGTTCLVFCLLTRWALVLSWTTITDHP